MWLAQWYMVSCTENLSKLDTLSGCRMKVRANMQGEGLPAFVNQTSVVNSRYKPICITLFLYACIQFCYFSSFHTLLPLAFPLKYTHTQQLFLPLPGYSIASTTTVHPLFLFQWHDQPSTLACSLLSHTLNIVVM